MAKIRPADPTLSFQRMLQMLLGPRSGAAPRGDVRKVVELCRTLLTEQGEFSGRRIATDALPAMDWIPVEWVRFLDEQPADLADERLEELRSTYGLGADGNAEIALSWLELVIRAGYEPAYPDVERFLLNTGRWRLVETLFSELSRTETGRALGERIYDKAKPGYHASIRQAVERLLYPESGRATAQ